AVRVPLIARPPGGCAPRVVGGRVEHFDMAATVRAIAEAPPLPNSEGRSLLGCLEGEDVQPRAVSVSENWGFAAFETDRSKLVVDEDALAPCQLFDLIEDPTEDHNLVSDPLCAPVVEELMELHVRAFFASRPARPHPSIFTGANSVGSLRSTGGQ